MRQATELHFDLGMAIVGIAARKCQHTPLDRYEPTLWQPLIERPGKRRLMVRPIVRSSRFGKARLPLKRMSAFDLIAPSTLILFLVNRRFTY
jgi:hypothetical protein